MGKEKVKVLFVCMGNICRSPTAEGVFRSLVEQEGFSHLIEIDSAGTHAYHVGERADPRSCQVAKDRGVDLSGIRARKVVESDFLYFDYILPMDSENHAHLSALAMGHSHKIRPFLEFSDEFSEKDVPDPYYGGVRGFDHVFDLVESASRGLLKNIVTKLSQNEY